MNYIIDQNPFTIDQNTYADPVSQELLADGAAYAAKNTIDPASLVPDYEELPDHLDSGMAVIVAGDPGTGKTTAVRLYAHSRGLPCKLYACHSSMKSNDLIGKVVFNPHEGIDGDMRKTVFIPRGFLDCYEKGYLCIADDLTKAPTDTMAAASEFALLPEIYQCVDDGKIYHRHPNFRLAITGNPGCEGHHPFPDELLSRCEYIDANRTTRKGFLLHGKTNWPFMSDMFFSIAFDICEAVNATAVGRHVSVGVRETTKLMKPLQNGLKIPTQESFVRRVNQAFINLLSQKLRRKEFEAFRDAQTTKSLILSLYQEYKTSPRPLPAGASQPPQPPQPQPAQKPKQSASEDLINQLFGGFRP